MDLSNFLNPAEEGMQEVEEGLDEDTILQEAMAPYIQVSDAQDDDDEEPQHPVLTTQNAVQALQVLIEFSESENISAVERDNEKTIDHADPEPVDVIHLADTYMYLVDYYHPKLMEDLYWTDVEGFFTPDEDGDFEFGLTVNRTGKLFL
ncbi:hypothetical protein VC83_03978 [Pseudogymnoascus destructans]|uniref:Uncharacterized protein n=2 Tax=Pseudogymnoascus destructans TaxID=655981 RepID=L8G8U2_PSED2|nr:uncharacterized protein VC83_03978 [Pseudogymnoascus destructans]ELR09058.1 hypothetical protein GMDG_03644 [Pseudogymnoascus destructans 20631-21]OAF59471.1 hypothetical protein VC83_03978 [Pseudogymnoascus destructans]